ncbi:MAG: pilus assembly protein TadD [Betaproteobacteria bacterium HGW-Betaproteobacteria-7]|jgi:tetratricopeptide (TPR) repeat protein|nr:MAG: pilus assembly protein TadD [Betaproteobacteria bacterium HGW-Betaproteobacteria-7]
MPAKFTATALTLALGLILAVPSQAAAPGKQAMPAESSENLLARTVFFSLLGELALQRGDTRLAVDAWSDLAKRTRDPAALARATEVAGFARQYEQALELASIWLEVEPDSTRARQTQSSLLVLANRLDELAPQLAILLERDKPNLAANLMHLNRMLARHENKKAVQELVEKLAVPYDTVPEAHFAVAQASANAGDNMGALTAIEKALLLRPDWETAALARAQIQARQSNASAIASLDEFVKRQPAAREARLALARLLIGEKRFADARQHFDRLLKDNPDNPEIIYPIAMLALQQGDTSTGRQQLERLLKSDFPDKSSVHFFLGQLDQEQKNLPAALEHYGQVSSGNQHVAARARSAQILLQQGKPNEARELLRNTRGGSDEERTQLTLAEAQLMRDAGRHADAYAVLTEALAGQPDNTDMLYDAALTAERSGRPELLEKHLQHLLSLRPDHAHALNALGYSLADRNIRLDEAFTLITRALILLPDDPFITDSLGWVQFRQGRLEEALATLERAYRNKPDPEIAAHLGEVLWTMGRHDDARRLLDEAARQHPDNETLAGTIKKLQP